MIFNKGKKYSNGIITFLSYILYNAKLIGLLISVPSVLYWFDRYTSSDSFGSGEYLFWYSCLFICSVLLFFIDKQWKKICDAIIELFAR